MFGNLCSTHYLSTTFMAFIVFLAGAGAAAFEAVAFIAFMALAMMKKERN